MAIELTETNNGNVLSVRLSGKLVHEDYLQYVPKFERLAGKQERLHVLLEIADFDGWDPDALVDEIRFDIKHFSTIERLAVIGDQKWEEMVSRICRPFTKAEIGYFDHLEKLAAEAWLERGEDATAPAKHQDVRPKKKII